jgi:AhpD family alkylhydroperoxidase
MAMQKDWKDGNKTLSAAISIYREQAPEVAAAFSGLAAAATKPGVLDTKTKELIALAIGIAGRCDGCVGFHTAAAIRQGATRAEVVETISMAIYMGGGPSYVYGAQALEAYDQLAAG